MKLAHIVSRTLAVKTQLVYYFLQYLATSQLGLLIYFLIYNSVFYWVLGSLSRVVLHTFCWNFVDFIWHSDCHGYLKVSHVLKAMSNAYLFLFWQGIDYDFLVLTHLKHHAYVDKELDPQRAQLNWDEITFWGSVKSNRDLSIDKNCMSQTSCADYRMLKAESRTQIMNFKRMMYVMLVLVLVFCSQWKLLVFFQWTSTVWQFNVKKIAHYSRSWYNQGNILKVSERTLLENLLIAYLCLDDFDHHHHHEYPRSLEKNIFKTFDGHLPYLLLISPLNNILVNIKV
mmetsp:Transcript_19381/g.65876  ORF Transcript_19381/g.65876 Transcript_19381/m.65876 type:complete len:285 (-) Transcript_19381:1618-2472(-)